MIRRLVRMLLALGAIAVTLALQASAAEQAPRVVNVEVSRKGWNGDPNLVLTVEEGEMVELRFRYGDGDLAKDNPHLPMIEGLNMETGELSQSSREQILRFRPERTGTYTLLCKVTCDGHEVLQSGKLRVVAAGASAGAKPDTTVVSVTTRPPAAAGEPAELKARVATDKGVALEGVMVDFAVKTPFFASAWMEVGQVRTGADGVATLRWKPKWGGAQTVRGRYAGSGRYLGSEEAVDLAVPAMAPVYEEEQRLQIPGLGFWLMWLVLACVWSAYSFVVYQMREIAHNR